MAVEVCKATVPDGVELVGDGDLYLVPFDLLYVAERQTPAAETYVWANPRHMGEQESAGMDEDELDALRTDLTEEGLLEPLIGTWVDGRVRITDGERRLTCLRRMVDEDVRCWSRQKGGLQQASEVYRRVLCRVLFGDDLESLRLAFMISERSVNWGEGPKLKVVQLLRKQGHDDRQILRITRKGSKWLREQDLLLTLDGGTLAHYFRNEVSRKAALKLARIPNEADRQKWFERAYALAVEDEKERGRQKQAECEIKKEAAECDLADREAEGADVTALREEIESLTVAAAEAVAQAKPQVKSSHVDKVAGSSGILKASVIRHQYEVIQTAIADGGQDKNGEFIIDTDKLEACEVVYRAILEGDQDVIKRLRRLRQSQALRQNRQKRS